VVPFLAIGKAALLPEVEVIFEPSAPGLGSPTLGKSVWERPELVSFGSVPFVSLSDSGSSPFVFATLSEAPAALRAVAGLFSSCEFSDFCLNSDFSAQANGDISSFTD